MGGVGDDESDDVCAEYLEELGYLVSVCDELDPSLLQADDELAPVHQHLHPRASEQHQGVHRHHTYLPCGAVVCSVQCVQCAVQGESEADVILNFTSTYFVNYNISEPPRSQTSQNFSKSREN